MTFLIDNLLLFSVIGVWVVYKFKNYIPLNEDIDDGEDGPFASYNEARVKTYRKVSNQYPNEEVNLSDFDHDDGSPGWMITVIYGLFEFIFIPFKKDNI